ncbi:hypothetical protein GQ85_15540, partial [Rhodococcus rhodochrous]
MDPLQRPPGAVGVVEQAEFGGPAAFRPRWVDDADRARYRGDGTHRGGEGQGRADSVVARERRNGQRGDGDAERQRHLPDPHGETALLRREPADDDATARGVGARRGGTAEGEHEREH